MSVGRLVEESLAVLVRPSTKLCLRHNRDSVAPHLKTSLSSRAPISRLGYRLTPTSPARTAGVARAAPGRRPATKLSVGKDVHNIQDRANPIPNFLCLNDSWTVMTVGLLCDKNKLQIPSAKYSERILPA